MRPLTVGNKQPLLAFCEENNPSWLLTARTFGSANNAKKATPSLIKRLLGKYEFSRVKAPAWGVMNETEAIKPFTAKKPHHNEVF